MASCSGFPQGLVGEIAQSFLDLAQHPNAEMSLAGAIGFASGLSQRAFNTPTGAGLNQYIMGLAPTGTGKDVVSRGTSLLTSAVQQSCPGIVDFRGPGELVSAAGLIKWLDRKPCVFSIVGEIGKLLKMMADPRANAHLTGLSRALLQIYSKSGEGEVFDPMAYSDKDKNTGAIQSPALTIFGESVPESFFEALDEGLISDGLLPRFLIFEANGPRSYRNKAADSYRLPTALIERVSELAAQSLSLMHRRAVQRVAWTAEAEAKFDQFDHWTTDEINRATGEVTRQLWNRAYLKALKLASLVAIGDNYVSPAVSLDHTMWATDLVANQTRKLIARFSSGDVGASPGNEAKQRAHVLRVMAAYFANKDPGPDHRKMVATMTITQSYLQQKLFTLPAFKPRPTQAIKDTIRSMVEADELREIPTSQMLEQHGTKAKAYALNNPLVLKPYLQPS